MNLSNGKDLTVNSMTQLNSAYKDLFAGISIKEKSRVPGAMLFFFYG